MIRARYGNKTRHDTQTPPVAMIIRDETPDDINAIDAVTTAAFKAVPYSDQTEAAIVRALRSAGALTVSLVALEDSDLVGHAAFSPVTVNGAPSQWYALGPISVSPGRQKQGIGGALIRQGLARLKAQGAHGCVLVGDPAYYARFGFKGAAEFCPPELPGEYFQVLGFDGQTPGGVIGFHAGFAVKNKQQ
jgi:putative acetyltransferase